jgi:exopolysaccharide biosynthesis polyprenyl glycosylphosphotransferase
MRSTSKTISFWLLVLPSVLLLYISLAISFYLRYQGNADNISFQDHARAFTAIYALWLLVFFIHGLFEIRTFRRYTSIVFNLFSVMAINLLVAITYFYLQPGLILTPRRFLLIHVGVSFALLVLWNVMVKYALSSRLSEGVYLFSNNDNQKELEQEIKSHGYMGFKVLGHLSDEHMPTLGLQKNSSIVLPDGLDARPEVIQKFYELRKLGIQFYNYQEFYERLLRRVHLSQLSELWFLENITYQEKRFYNLVKRLVDMLFGTAAGAVFLVTFPICALFIKASSAGPVFFIQERVGKDGRTFKVYKYRSMSGGATNTWTAVNDPRITVVGRFMRLSRLDELPQFINLLIGNMSLVGPRPEQVHIVEKLKQEIPFYDERHLVKPGLTGWAQLNIYAGSVEETKLKLQYDLYYIKHRGFLFDLEIILKTIYYIFTWQGR